MGGVSENAFFRRRVGARWRQGWDVWLGGKFAGALSSRTLSDLATLSRGELLAVLRPACCGRHRELQEHQPRLLSVRPGGGENLTRSFTNGCEVSRDFNCEIASGNSSGRAAICPLRYSRNCRWSATHWS